MSRIAQKTNFVALTAAWEVGVTRRTQQITKCKLHEMSRFGNCIKYPNLHRFHVCQLMPLLEVESGGVNSLIFYWKLHEMFSSAQETHVC